jgi:hypothetical protein
VFFGLKDEIFMEDGALQWYRPCPSAAYAAYAFYFSQRNKTLNNTVNYEFTLFLYTLGSDMSRIKRVFCVRHI